MFIAKHMMVVTCSFNADGVTYKRGQVVALASMVDRANLIRVAYVNRGSVADVID